MKSEREEVADESCDELTRLLAMFWYTLEQPWCHSDQSGTLILAGSNDPHVGVPICETDDLVGDYYDRETAMGLAQHIVDMHNASNDWQPINTLKLGGDAVLLFSEKWKDSDFNTDGIREGFRNESDEGPIYSARWNDCHECWETVVNYEATHWMPRPAPPQQEK